MCIFDVHRNSNKIFNYKNLSLQRTLKENLASQKKFKTIVDFTRCIFFQMNMVLMHISMLLLLVIFWNTDFSKSSNSLLIRKIFGMCGTSRNGTNDFHTEIISEPNPINVKLIKPKFSLCFIKYLLKIKLP